MSRRGRGRASKKRHRETAACVEELIEINLFLCGRHERMHRTKKRNLRVAPQKSDESELVDHGLNFLLSALCLGTKSSERRLLSNPVTAFSGGPKEFWIWESGARKFFGWWCHRKQKERHVQSAGITPEAVPRKGAEEEKKQNQRRSRGSCGWNRNSSSARPS
jgi:hypothetical protein